MGILSVQRANTGTIPLKMRTPEIAQITAPTAAREWTVNDMRLGDLDALEQFFLHESKRLREFMNSEDCDQEERKYISTFLPTVEWARKTVHGISTIDAVPVVRCKDCKYWHESTGFCSKNSYFIDSNEISCSPLESPNWTTWEENDFCSNGEMKDK